MGSDPSVMESIENRKSQEKMFDTQLAYQKALDTLGRQKGEELMASGEKQLMEGTESAPDELQQIMSDYAAENLLGQQEGRRAFDLNLENSGVRGGQAATLKNRASGDVNRGLSSDINKLAYDDAVARRSERNKYASDKAAMGSAGYAR